MTVTQSQIHHRPLECRFETDALDLELFLESLGDTLDHVVDQGPSQAVHRLGFSRLSGSAQANAGSIHLGVRESRQRKAQITLGTFYRHSVSADGDLNLGRNGYRTFSNT